MHLKDVVIKRVPEARITAEMDPQTNIRNRIEYHIPAQQGSTIEQYLTKVLESVEGSYISNPKRFGEMLSYVKSVIWANFNSKDKGQLRHYKYLEEAESDLRRISGKQPRKGQEQLNDAVKDFILTCEEIIHGRIY